MKTFLYAIGSVLLQRTLSSQGGQKAIDLSAWTVLSRMERGHVVLSILTMLSLIYFTIGSSVMLLALTLSYQELGFFSATPVFYGGLTLTVLGLAGSAVVYRQVKRLFEQHRENLQAAAAQTEPSLTGGLQSFVIPVLAELFRRRAMTPERPLEAREKSRLSGTA